MAPTKDIKKKNRYNLRSTKKKELETKLKSNSKDSDLILNKDRKFPVKMRWIIRNIKNFFQNYFLLNT